MFKNRKIIFIVAISIMIVAIISSVFVLFKPTQDKNIEEANDTEAMQNTEEADVTGTAHNTGENANINDAETDDLEMNHANEEDSEIDGDTEEDVTDISENENSEAKQHEYVGRQPPKDYVEPEGSERYAFQLEFKDTYQSNIIIIKDDLFMIEVRDYEWFHATNDDYGVMLEVQQFICYAILTYYDGDVPCDYYVDLEEDIHNAHPRSSMIFEVQTHGDKPLNICLDTYNYKIYVEEGLIKKA